MEVGSNGFILNEGQKRFLLPLHAQLFVQLLQSTVLLPRTIVAMFKTLNRYGLDTVQLMETVLSQSSPQLTGPSFISRSSL